MRLISRTSACALVLMCAKLAPAQLAEMQTINIDFGNGGAYIGDDGVISSDGGTYWNTIEFLEGPGYLFAEQFRLRDEFGNQIDFTRQRPRFDQGFPLIRNTSDQMEEFEGSGEGPLSDGVAIRGRTNDPGPGISGAGFLIVELDEASVSEVIVYFSRPAGSPQSRNAVMVGPAYEDPSGLGYEPQYSDVVTGQFPGVEGLDWVRFSNVPSAPTTIGYPEVNGIEIYPPEIFGGQLETANIAAMQIRGRWVVTPEPGSLILAAGLAILLISQRNTMGWR